MSEEIWTAVIGYEGRYEISDLGRRPGTQVRGGAVQHSQCGHGRTWAHLPL
ncbi:hypothetical protein GFK26_18000 [Variovorax paradoxus]|uniref:NUMOD4 domain-containing protein n=1 Tax=Variovorax paradoxus TaxID=34073 RepID=A0A5Q0M4Q7_VARPD|nr:hypothetical protein GFK26_18000 [Variovorax paradoxus]